MTQVGHGHTGKDYSPGINCALVYTQVNPDCLPPDLDGGFEENLKTVVILLVPSNLTVWGTDAS